MKPVESVIILPSLELFVNPALAFIRSTAINCGFSETALNQIETASEEALTNVIKHAFEGHSDETFKLSVCFNESDFIIIIHEKGMPFSPDGVSKYEPEKLESNLNTDGLGFFMMKKMMDEVKFENLGRDGKSLTLIKRLKDGHIKRPVEGYKNKVLINNSTGRAVSDIQYEIRIFKPEDALEISRCAYKSYGYTYEPYIYYPEKIIEMNQSGNLRSFVAAGKNDGEIMGHIAFKYKNPQDCIAEIGVAFVKPEYRKSGVYKSMMDYSHLKAAELKLFGLFGRAVTSHIGSQKILEPMGYIACGIFFGLFPDDVDFKAIIGKIKQKESGLLFYRPMLNDGKRKIYAPSKHKKKLADIFASFNIPVDICETDAKPESGNSKINVNIVPALNIADIEVEYIGADIVHELKSIRHDLCLKRVDAIFLHLDMQDPSFSQLADECERSGFFFSGVLPFGLNNNHKFILQYMNNLNVNYDIIKPYSQNALEILNYAKSFNVNSETY